MTAEFDLAVIGAGPAGMAAAVAADALGLSIAVLDEQPAPGGQIYRNVEAVRDQRPADLAFLGQDYASGAALADGLRGSRAAYLPESTVWHLAPDTDAEDGGRHEIIYSRAGKAARLRARSVLIATGAMERPVPVPGWTLPGVMTIGAAQSALKAAGVFPGGCVVLAGSGPLLLQFAAQCIAARIPLAAILDTTPPGALARGLPHLPLAAAGGQALLKGLGLMRAVAKGGVPVTRGVSGIAAAGDGRLQTVRYTANGVAHEIAADVLCLHEGVVPNPQVTRLAGLDHRWDERQRCFHPVLDDWGAGSVPGIHVAGDGGGILGAAAAARSGRVAALDIAARLGRIGESERDFRAAAERLHLFAERAVRRLVDAMYPPPDWIGVVDDAVMICRCEEVTAGALRAVVAHGCQGPNQAKAFLRCGMGPCQGRLCGLTVTEVLASARRVAPEEIGYYRIRPPIKPVTIGELASLGDGD